MTSTSDSTLLRALRTNWLIGLDAQAIVTQFQANVAALQQMQQASGTVPTVLIAEPDPVQFLADFFAAVVLDCPVFLANPAWKALEWQQVWAQVQPDVVWGTATPDTSAFGTSTLQPGSTPTQHVPPNHCSASSGWIMIPTGGTSGRIRFVIHTWETLMASVEGFRQFFKVDAVNAYCVLPLYHVSGLMQVLRCVASGGTLAIAPFKVMEHSPDLLCQPHDFFLSLVPTQLQRLMRSPIHRQHLTKFRTILLGGAPAWPSLLDAARSYGIPLAPTYGMTETASQVVTLHPERFLEGHSSVGQMLPHAKISIEALDNDQTVEDLPAFATVGEIAIQCSSLALGYYPDQWFSSGIYRPDDLGYFDSDQELHLVGRKSDKIISGGENIFPAEVEAAIRSTGLVSDVAVFGMGDRHWGQVVIAMYIPIEPEVNPDMMKRQLTNRLSRYKHPKRWISMTQLPRNAQGKINRNELIERAIAILDAENNVTLSEPNHQELR
jgi:O-succinylbenzoic acid--CoA ligase